MHRECMPQVLYIILLLLLSPHSVVATSALFGADTHRSWGGKMYLLHTGF